VAVDHLTALDLVVGGAASPRSGKRIRRHRVEQPDGLRTAAEAAARLGCSIKTLMGHVRSGALRYVVIGHGRKRPRKMFADDDLADFTGLQTRKDSPVCPSSRTDARHSGATISRSEVVAFSARRNARTSVKLKK
jgi:hypothetical protein